MNINKFQNEATMKLQTILQFNKEF